MDDLEILHAHLMALERPRLIEAERDRRLAMGFDYDFGDARGVHRIGTTESDMRGWQEVTLWSHAAMALDAPNAPIGILTDTGPVTVTAREWQEILMAATDFRQPIWHASFSIAALNPPPADVAADELWPA